MTNFRAERLLIRVAGALDFDPNAGIDVAEFALIMVCDSGGLDRPSLQEFSFAPYEYPRWFPAASGLAVVRAVIRESEAELANSDEHRRPQIEKKIAVLQAVEAQLDRIDLKDYQFHFQVRDLG